MAAFDDRLKRLLEAEETVRRIDNAKNREAVSIDDHLLHGGGGGSTSGGMESRVTKLETHMEYVRRDLDSILLTQDKILEKLGALPTRSDLNTWRWQWIAAGLAIIALTVGGITGGLALIAKFAG